MEAQRKAIGNTQPNLVKWIVCVISICISLTFIIVFSNSKQSGIWLGWAIAILFSLYNILSKTMTANVYLNPEGITVERMHTNYLYTYQDFDCIKSNYLFGLIQFKDNKKYYFLKDANFLKHFFTSSSGYEQEITRAIDSYYFNLNK